MYINNADSLDVEIHNPHKCIVRFAEPIARETSKYTNPQASAFVYGWMDGCKCGCVWLCARSSMCACMSAIMLYAIRALVATSKPYSCYQAIHIAVWMCCCVFSFLSRGTHTQDRHVCTNTKPFRFVDIHLRFYQETLFECLWGSQNTVLFSRSVWHLWRERKDKKELRKRTIAILTKKTKFRAKHVGQIYQIRK